MTSVVAGVALAAALGSMVFAGVSGVANSSMAWQQYLKDHPGRSGSGKCGRFCSMFGCLRCHRMGSDYVETNFICNCKLMDKELFLAKRTHLLRPRNQQIPVQSRRTRFTSRFKAGVRRALHPERSRSRRLEQTEGRVTVGPLQNTNHPLGDNYIGPNSIHLQNGKHGVSPPVSGKCTALHMGRQAAYSQQDAEAHWATFQLASFTADAKTAPPSIAVVNWTAQVITMYVKSLNKEKEAFYRNYQVHNPNLALFEKEFREFVVYSGVIEQGTLTGTDSQIVVAKDNRKCAVKSVNSWSCLGFVLDSNPEAPLQSLFLAMKRAAVFGIIESLYREPTLLDVTMLDGGEGCQTAFARVHALDTQRLEPKPDNIFSVFAFNARIYANEQVLVG